VTSNDLAFNARFLRYLGGRFPGASLRNAPNSKCARRIRLFQRRASRSDEFHFFNPEQFAIGVLLHLWRCEIRGARIHPPTGVSGLVAVEAMAHCALGAEEFVSFFDARLQIRWCWGNTVAAGSSNQDVFSSCRENGFRDSAHLV
jgi:hypothetical protein